MDFSVSRMKGCFLLSSQFTANQYYKKSKSMGFNDYTLFFPVPRMKMLDISDKVSVNYYVPFEHLTLLVLRCSSHNPANFQSPYIKAPDNYGQPWVAIFSQFAEIDIPLISEM
jgi:hypothetical protein